MSEFGVLWDMDGTLVDSEPLHEETLLLSLQDEGITPPPDLHDRVLGLSAAAIHRMFRAQFGLSAPFDAWRRRRNLAYHERSARLLPRPGAIELFHELSARGARQAVVSNAERAILEINLRAVGLTQPDLVTVSRNDVRQGKPDPESYLRAAWLLGLSGREVTVVEDSSTGAMAGVAAGFRTLFWPQSPMAAPVGATCVSDAAELRRMLAMA